MLQRLLIGILQPGEESHLYSLHQVQFLGFTFAHKAVRKEWCNPGRIENTGHQGKEDRPGKELDKLT